MGIMHRMARGATIGMLAISLLAGAQDDPVFRTSVSLVRVDAQVAAGAQIVDGLQKRDFTIRDNGRPQRILYCSQEEEPLDLMILVDSSGSMEHSVRRLAASAHAALAELRTGDRVAVAHFNTESWLIGPFSDNLREVAETLDRIVDLRFGGGTHILSAVNDAAGYFAKNADERRRHAILIFTDNFGQVSMSERAVVNRMWAADVLLCGLIVRLPGNRIGPIPWWGEEDMLGVARKTGGETVNAGDPGGAFREMLHRMRKRYSIYYEMPVGKAGASRRVSVELSDGPKARYPGAVVLARKGYVIPKLAAK